MPKPKPNETEKDYIKRCMSDSEMKTKHSDYNERFAVCKDFFVEYEANFESYNDYPKQASENAKIALRWAEEHGWGDCLEATGKARANQLANGENISEDTIARMASFARHKQHSDRPLGEGCGRLAWLAWGGDAGIEWAQRKLKQIRK